MFFFFLIFFLIAFPKDQIGNNQDWRQKINKMESDPEQKKRDWDIPI